MTTYECDHCGFRVTVTKVEQWAAPACPRCRGANRIPLYSKMREAAMRANRKTAKGR